MFKVFFNAEWLKYLNPYTILAQLEIDPEMSIYLFMCYIGTSFVDHSILKIEWTDFDAVLQFNDSNEIEEYCFHLWGQSVASQCYAYHFTTSWMCDFFFPNSFYCLGSSFIVYLLTPVVLFLSEDDNLPRYTWMVGESQCHNPCSLFLMKYFFPLNHRNRCSNTTMQNLLSSHFESKQPLQPMEKGPVPNSFTRKFKIKLLCISILAAAYVCLIKY